MLKNERGITGEQKKKDRIISREKNKEIMQRYERTRKTLFVQDTDTNVKMMVKYHDDPYRPILTRDYPNNEIGTLKIYILGTWTDFRVKILDNHTRCMYAYPCGKMLGHDDLNVVLRRYHNQYDFDKDFHTIRIVQYDIFPLVELPSIIFMSKCKYDQWVRRDFVWRRAEAMFFLEQVSSNVIYYIFKDMGRMIIGK